MIAKNSIRAVSVNTKVPPMQVEPRCEKKSIMIRQCKCGARFEVTNEFQSKKQCPECVGTSACVHGVATTKKCTDCYRRHGNWFMRTL